MYSIIIYMCIGKSNDWVHNQYKQNSRSKTVPYSVNICNIIKINIIFKKQNIKKINIFIEHMFK